MICINDYMLKSLGILVMRHAKDNFELEDIQPTWNQIEPNPRLLRQAGDRAAGECWGHRGWRSSGKWKGWRQGEWGGDWLRGRVGQGWHNTRHMSHQFDYSLLDISELPTKFLFINIHVWWQHVWVVSLRTHGQTNIQNRQTFFHFQH